MLGTLVPSPEPEQLEHCEPLLVAAHRLAVDQAGPHLEVVHSLDDERIPGGPVMAVTGEQPDADRIAPGHQAIAVVLDLVNPVRAGRGLSAVGRQHGSMKPTMAGAEDRADMWKDRKGWSDGKSSTWQVGDRANGRCFVCPMQEQSAR